MSSNDCNPPVRSPFRLSQAPPTTPFIRGRSQPFPPPVGRGYPEHPFVRGQSRPFPPPTGRNYPRHPYLDHHGLNPALPPPPPAGGSITGEAAEPSTSRPAQQDGSSPLSRALTSRRVHLETLGGGLEVQTRSELEKYFDVELWGWHLAPGDFQLGACWLATSELETRDKDQEFGKKRREGGRFQRFRLMFTCGILKPWKGNNKDREGEVRRRTLKDSISAPLKSRIL
ncbi:hypothetical protein Q9L58_003754 [Maublancomyces gigas]|uniref:Uncharacterized protein n=1 Tax=Discina gigas TaxID=1032678 RepID=A0ABR3GN84_9PEZI